MWGKSFTQNYFAEIWNGKPDRMSENVLIVILGVGVMPTILPTYLFAKATETWRYLILAHYKNILQHYSKRFSA